MLEVRPPRRRAWEYSTREPRLCPYGDAVCEGMQRRGLTEQRCVDCRIDAEAL